MHMDRHRSSTRLGTPSATLILAKQHSVAHILAWSDFRELSRERARAAHYRKRLERLGSYDPP
jgi:hypothetical protein